MGTHTRQHTRVPHTPSPEAPPVRPLCAWIRHPGAGLRAQQRAARHQLPRPPLASFPSLSRHLVAPPPSVPELDSAPDRALCRSKLPQIDRAAPSVLPAPPFKPPKQSHFLPALKTFSSFRGAIRRQTRADGAARPHLGAALQVPSHAFFPPGMPPGRRAQGPSSPPARRSGSERPRNARPASPFGPSPVLLGALPPPGEATRSVGLRGGTQPSAACAPGARALRPSGTCRPAPRAPCALWPSLSLSVHVLFFYVSTLTYFSSFFPSPPLSCIHFFPKADLRRCKWEKGLSLSRTLPRLVVAVAAARRRASSLPLRSASSQGCERARRLRPPAGDPSPPARRMPSRAVAGSPGWHGAALRCSPPASCGWRASGLGRGGAPRPPRVG